MFSMLTVRAGSVAVAGHALDCAECAGNALECAVCAELRQVRRIAPIAANCAVCALFAPIALELRWNSAYSLAHSHIPMAGAAWLRPPYLQPAVSGQCLSCQAFVAHYSTSSRSPAIFLQLSVMQRDKQCRSKTKCVVIASH